MNRSIPRLNRTLPNCLILNAGLTDLYREILGLIWPLAVGSGRSHVWLVHGPWSIVQRLVKGGRLRAIWPRCGSTDAAARSRLAPFFSLCPGSAERSDSVPNMSNHRTVVSGQEEHMINQELWPTGLLSSGFLGTKGESNVMYEGWSSHRQVPLFVLVAFRPTESSPLCTMYKQISHKHKQTR